MGRNSRVSEEAGVLTRMNRSLSSGVAALAALGPMFGGGIVEVMVRNG